MIPFYLLFGLLVITIFYVILVVSLEFTLFIFNLSRATFEWYDTTSHICYLTTIEFHFPLTSSYLTENFIHCFFKYFFLSCFSLFPLLTHILDHMELSHSSQVFCFCCCCFSVCVPLCDLFSIVSITMFSGSQMFSSAMFYLLVISSSIIFISDIAVCIYSMSLPNMLNSNASFLNL